MHIFATMRLLVGTAKFPALAAVAGLVLGLICRPQSGSKPSLERDPAEKQSTAARGGKSTAANRGALRESGLTTLFLNELASAPAGRCDELFRELVAENDPRGGLELEAVFRRWMELEEPKELLARLAADLNPTRSGRLRSSKHGHQSITRRQSLEPLMGLSPGSALSLRSAGATRRF